MNDNLLLKMVNTVGSPTLQYDILYLFSGLTQGLPGSDIQNLVLNHKLFDTINKIVLSRSDNLKDFRTVQTYLRTIRHVFEKLASSYCHLQAELDDTHDNIDMLPEHYRTLFEQADGVQILEGIQEQSND